MVYNTLDIVLGMVVTRQELLTLIECTEDEIEEDLTEKFDDNFPDKRTCFIVVLNLHENCS